MGAWVTVRKYAESRGVSGTTVRKKIKRGDFQMKILNNTMCIYDETADAEQDAQNTLADAQTSQRHYQSLEDKWDVENTLKRAKIENIRADIQLKKQKVIDTRERYRVSFCEGVLEAFTDAFADLKSVLVELKMRKEQIQRFKQGYGKCLKRFEAKLVEYLKQKDDEEAKEAETTEA